MVALTAALCGGLLLTTNVTRAQEREAEGSERPWTNNAELSLVAAAGNSTATTFGFRNVYGYAWERSRLSWEAGWVRADSRDGRRLAVGFSDQDFELVEPPTKIDSERMHSKLGYRQDISGAHFWFGNFDSARDKPSNINRQFVAAGGFGTRWADRERLRFRTEYGISYTTEDLDLEGENHFGGYRLSYGLDAGVTGNATIESGLTLDGSLQQGRGIRTDWLNGVSVSLSSRIALKSSLRLLFRNIPALERVKLQTPVLGAVIGTVEVPKNQIDTNFTTSLVITF